MENKMFITRVSLEHDGICVWFGRQQRHFEGNYWVGRILSLGETDTHDHSTMWGWVDHLRSKNWWTPELEGQVYDECKELIGEHGIIVLK